jgi:hypothetical protein
MRKGRKGMEGEETKKLLASDFQKSLQLAVYNGIKENTHL